MRRLKPERLEDIIALVALYRPGPLGTGMVDDFVQRKHGRVKVAYPHKCLEKILKDAKDATQKTLDDIKDLIGAGADGVFMEVHENPDKAPSDGPNMVPLRDMPALLHNLMQFDNLAKANPVRLA